jgi:hypothetical protein
MEIPSQPIVRLRRSARLSKMTNDSRAVGKKPRWANPAHGQKKFLLWIQKTPRELSVWGGARNAVARAKARRQAPAIALYLRGVVASSPLSQRGRDSTSPYIGPGSPWWVGHSDIV